MSKMCKKCLHFYEENLNICPYCNTPQEGDNPVLFNKKEEEKKENSIIFMPDEVVKEESKKESSNTKKTKKNSKINIYSYVCLIVSFVLLFIISLYTVSIFNAPIFFHYSITAIFLILAFRFSLKSVSGYYIGIISSISMIVMLYWKDYVNFVVGIYLLVSSLVMLIKGKIIE